jgi:hypothetical protein
MSIKQKSFGLTEVREAAQILAVSDRGADG